MKKKVWFYLSIVQSIILIGVLCLFIWESIYLNYSNVYTVDLLEIVDKYEEIYVPEKGFVPDARAAKIIGEQAIDGFRRSEGEATVNVLSLISVEYDAENRLWRVDKAGLFWGGAFAIIDQDTGEIILVQLKK